MSEYISINKVALKLDTSVNTIKRWYKWFEDDCYDHADLSLPPYYYLDARKTKMFKVDDIKKLKEFQKLISTSHKGIMSTFNASWQWGTKGKEILERKEQKNEQSKN